MPDAKRSPAMADRSPILTEAKISQWLKDHRVEYSSATDTMKACLNNFGLHRRHRRLVWGIYSRTDFSHMEQRED